MYDDAMTGVSKHLIGKTANKHLTYTNELIPSRTHGGDMSVCPLRVQSTMSLTFVLLFL